jgi:predicted RNase H-like HicB family nuclease
MSNLKIEYWIDDGWYVGKLKEVPGVFSQGETVDELIANIRDAYQLVLEENQYFPVKEYKTIDIQFDF